MKIFILILLLVISGMPAAHGLSGYEFGKAVSGLAHTYPGAVADHVAHTAE